MISGLKSALLNDQYKIIFLSNREIAIRNFIDFNISWV